MWVYIYEEVTMIEKPKGDNRIGGREKCEWWNGNGMIGEFWLKERVFLREMMAHAKRALLWSWVAYIDLLQLLKGFVSCCYEQEEVIGAKGVIYSDPTDASDDEHNYSYNMNMVWYDMISTTTCYSLFGIAQFSMEIFREEAISFSHYMEAMN